MFDITSDRCFRRAIFGPFDDHNAWEWQPYHWSLLFDLFTHE